MKTKIDKSARLVNAMNSAGARHFRCESCYAEHDAPRNLSGRTHYADEDTLRYFKSRMLNAGMSEDGLLYWMVESVGSRPDHGGWNRRAIVFDVFGTVLNEREEWFKDTAKAVTSALEFVKGFDAVTHTATVLEANAKRDINAAKKTLAALAGR